MSQIDIPADIPSERRRPRRPLSIGAGAVVVHSDRVLLVRNIYGVTKGRYQPAAGPPSNPGFVMFAGSRMRSSSSSERLVFSRATSRTVFPVL